MWCQAQKGDEADVVKHKRVMRQMWCQVQKEDEADVVKHKRVMRQMACVQKSDEADVVSSAKGGWGRCGQAQKSVQKSDEADVVLSAKGGWGRCGQAQKSDGADAVKHKRFHYNCLFLLWIQSRNEVRKLDSHIPSYDSHRCMSPVSLEQFLWGGTNGIGRMD